MVGAAAPLSTFGALHLPGPLTEKGRYFQKSGCENRTRAQKLSTRRAPLATSFSENRTPASKNRTLPMAGSCSRPAGYQLAWLLAESLGSLQDGLPTWLRRAWPQQAAEDAWPTLAMTCKLQKTRSYGRGQVNIRAHCRKRFARPCYSRSVAAAAVKASRFSRCIWFTWMASPRCRHPAAACAALPSCATW